MVYDSAKGVVIDPNVFPDPFKGAPVVSRLGLQVLALSILHHLGSEHGLLLNKVNVDPLSPIGMGILAYWQYLSLDNNPQARKSLDKLGKTMKKWGFIKRPPVGALFSIFDVLTTVEARILKQFEDSKIGEP